MILKKQQRVTRQAFAAKPRATSRILYEMDQLDKRRGNKPAGGASGRCSKKNAGLGSRAEMISPWKLVTLYNESREIPGARWKSCWARRFHPWEGGEGGWFSAQYVAAHVILGPRVT